MRTYNSNFNILHNHFIKYPRWVISIEFETDDVVYFTSHNDCDVPAGASVVYDVVRSPILTSQKLPVGIGDSSIGTITFKLIDDGSVVTDLFNSKAGLRHRTVVVYRGYKGLSFSDYVKPPGATQSIDGKISYNKGAYSILCRDLQRGTQEDICDAKMSTLTKSIGFGEVFIPIIQPSLFETITHGPSFTDAPNKSAIGYIDIDKETIRWSGKDVSNLVTDNNNSNLSLALQKSSSTLQVNNASLFRDAGVGCVSDGVTTNSIRWSGKNGNQLTGVYGVLQNFSIGDIVYDAIGRGALNSRASEHKTDLSKTLNGKKVSERIYLEFPATKTAYMLFTGEDPQNPGVPAIPSHWHLGIKTSLIDLDSFSNIGIDLWDTSDDAAGFILRFAKLTKRKAKKFISEQINTPQSCFIYVMSDGKLGYKRRTRVLSSASPIALLNKHNVKSYSPISFDNNLVSNRYELNWNYDYTDGEKGKPTRRNSYIDTTSIIKNKKAPKKVYSFEGLSGTRHTDSILNGVFNGLRDGFAGPPVLISVDCFQSLSALELSDVVWCQFDQRDFIGGGTLERAFEVISYKDTGDKITLSLFGSSSAAGAIVSSENPNVMDNSFYSAAVGLLEANKFDQATSGYLSGDVWHITGINTLSGGSDVTSPDNIYWFDNDVQLDSGATLNYTGNVQIRCHHFQYNGKIRSTGGGHLGSLSSTGITGFIGNTISGGSLYNFRGKGFSGKKGMQLSGKNQTPPYLQLINSGVSLSGIEKDMRPSSGSAGAFFNTDYNATYFAGGQGGDGAGALVFIVRSASNGVNGTIDSSGNDGQRGGYGRVWTGSGFVANMVAAGTGAGGAAGPVYFLIDGKSSTVPAGSSIISVSGDSVAYGKQSVPLLGHDVNSLYSGPYPGLIAKEEGANVLKIQYIPENESAEEDIDTTTEVASGIDIAEGIASDATLNLAILELSVTPPADGNYLGSNLYVKENGSDSWTYVGLASSTEVLPAYVKLSAQSFDVKAHPVAISGEESPEYIASNINLSNSAGDTVIGANSRLITSDTVGQSSNGQGLEFKDSGLFAYDGGGNIKFSLDAATGDGVFTGTIIANAGIIGGWLLDSTYLASPNGMLVLDAANNYIRATQGSNFVQISGDGILGVDSILGTTVDIPTDGGKPTFSSGIIREFEFEIYTSGVIRTSADPATDGGILINTAGQSVYNTSGVRTVFLDAINSNHEFTGKVTIGTASTGYSNISDKPADIDILNDFANIARLGLYSGGDIAAASNTEEAVAFKMDNATANNDTWFKLAECELVSDYRTFSMSGQIKYGTTDRPQFLQIVDISFEVGINPSISMNNFQVQMQPMSSLHRLEVYFEDPAISGNPKISVYAVMAAWRGMVANLSITRNTDSLTKVWQRGDNLGSGFVPAGTRIVATINRGVSDDADITALNTAADAAAVNGRLAADVDGDAAAGATYTGDMVGNQGGMLPNWACNIADINGKPAGIRGIASITDQSGIEFGDSAKTYIRLTHSTDNAFAYGFPAIPIDGRQQYRVTIRHRSSGATVSGLYLRMLALDSDLQINKTHLGDPANGGAEPFVQQYSNSAYLLNNGPMPGTSWVESTFTYTPAVGAKWASFAMYKWGTGTSHYYELDAVMITPIAKTADQISESGARKWAGESGADITAGNTAANIAGQGALATKNSADYGSDVSGTKPPANADATQPALETGVVLTAGGIDIGGSDAKIRIGSAIGYLNGAGVFAGMVGGNAGFSVGDPAKEEYLSYSPTTGSVELGRNTKLRGADAYNNNNLYINQNFESLDGFLASSASGGSVTIDSHILYLQVAAQSASFAGIGRTGDFELDPPSWDGDVYIKSRIGFLRTVGVGKTFSFGVGTTPANKTIMFRLKTDDIFYASTSDGVSSVETSTGVSIGTAGGSYLFEINKTGGTVLYYINGALVATHNAWVPDGPFDHGNSNLWVVAIGNPSGVGTGSALTGKIKVLFTPL